MNREHWQALAHKHSRCDTDPRRCHDCAAYWPCCYRLRANTELDTRRPAHAH
ncbi:hypothetical protein [Micromonospora sp. NBC_00421]|uniref:hypothetical protein n=1 Tax=Micromonospora sp. NBC_00421 TaxID=2975976 RepID=UPI002E1BB9E9